MKDLSLGPSNRGGSQPHEKKIVQVRASRAVAPRLPRSPARPRGPVPHLPVHSLPLTECACTLLAGSPASAQEFLSYPIHVSLQVSGLLELLGALLALVPPRCKCFIYLQLL